MSRPNPMAGGLLSGIQGFNKNKLKDADTNDKSAPATSKSGPTGGPGPARPGMNSPPSGGGPFGIPPGGIAGLKKTNPPPQNQPAPMFAQPPTPRSGPPPNNPPPAQASQPPRMGAPPSQGPPPTRPMGPPAVSSNPPARPMGPPAVSAGPPSRPMGQMPPTPAASSAPPARPTPAAAASPPMGMPRAGPPSSAPTAQAADARPANPMAGGLLSGIQGFNKNKLKDADTNDKSAPATSKSGPTGGPGPARPGMNSPPSGGGPFGIPPGGIAGLKKTNPPPQNQPAPMFAQPPTPRSGPPPNNPPPAQASQPPRMGAPPSQGPPPTRPMGPPAVSSNPPARPMGPPAVSAGPPSRPMGQMPPTPAASSAPPARPTPAAAASPPMGMPRAGPPSSAPTAQAADARPANPMAGGLLSGIQGFNKNKLKDADTNDKSAPATSKSGPTGGPGPARPGMNSPPSGGGPFGIPPGGIAGLKKTNPPPQNQPAPMFAQPPTPRSGPPPNNPPPAQASQPPRMGAPPSQGPPPPVAHPPTPMAVPNPPMGQMPPTPRGPPPGARALGPPTPRSGPPPNNPPPAQGPPTPMLSQQQPPTPRGPPGPRDMGPPPTAKPPQVGGFNPSTFRAAPPSAAAPPTPSASSAPSLREPVQKSIAWYSIFALGEHLIDHILSHGLQTENLFRDKGYPPQVDTLFAFATPANTYAIEAHGQYLHDILPQLTTDYLNSFSPLAVAEVLRKWIKEVHVFPKVKVDHALKIAAIPDPNTRVSEIKQLLENCDLSTQSFVAHILQMCNILWFHENTTKTNKAQLAYTFGPILFPIVEVTLETQQQMKNINRLVEDMIQNVSTISVKGLAVLQSNQYQ